MVNKYIVEIKGIKENKHCWNTNGVYDTLKEAVKHYNYFRSGCHKRIRRVRTIKETKIMRLKKY